MIEKIIPTRVKDVDGKDKVLPVPVYSIDEVPPLYCNRYVRLAARDLFGLNYAACSAWDRIYEDRVVAELPEKKFRELRELFSRRIVKPGMVIGMINHLSGPVGRTDEKGREAEFAHNTLFLGANERGDLVFAHQVNYGTFVQTAVDLIFNKIRPKVVVAPKD